MTGRHDHRLPHRQLAAVLVGDHRLEPLLDRGPELVRVHGVDPAVHEPKAIGRTYDRIRGNVEYRSAVNGNEWQIAAPALPRIGQLCINCRKCDLQF